MRDRYYYDHILNYDLALVKDFGVFHVSVAQGAKLITKILALGGDIELELPNIPHEDTYSLYDDSLDVILAKEIQKYQNLIISGINAGTLKTAKIQRKPDETISIDQTYVDMEVLRPWLEERSIDIYGDWYQQYESDEINIAEALIKVVEIRRKVLLGSHKNVAKEKSDNYEELSQEDKIILLKSQIDELQLEKAKAWQNSWEKRHDKSPPKPLHTKERETLLKMVIGMAVDAYGYDPKSNRSPIPKEIADALAEKDMSIDPDTVRKWLREASELLPQDSRESDS